MKNPISIYAKELVNLLRKHMLVAKQKAGQAFLYCFIFTQHSNKSCAASCYCYCLRTLPSPTIGSRRHQAHTLIARPAHASLIQVHKQQGTAMASFALEMLQPLPINSHLTRNLYHFLGPKNRPSSGPNLFFGPSRLVLRRLGGQIRFADPSSAR